MCVLALVETVMLGVAQTRGTSTWFRAIGIILISLCFFLFLIFASQRRRRVLQANVPTDWKPTPHVCDQEYSSKLTVRYTAVTAFF